jgi:hypothetical protein
MLSFDNCVNGTEMENDTWGKHKIDTNSKKCGSVLLEDEHDLYSLVAMYLEQAGGRTDDQEESI